MIVYIKGGCEDRYEEFQRIQSFDVEVSISFSIGKIQGYFNGNPLLEFWNVLSIYIAYNLLSSIVWDEKFGKNDVDGMKKRWIDAFYEKPYNIKTETVYIKE